MKLQDKLNKLQEEKHQLFLQLKKVLHEEEKRRRKEQSSWSVSCSDLTTLTSAAYQQGMVMHPGAHLINMQGSPGGHSRHSSLMADRAKQMFGPPVITGRHYPTQPSFSPTAAEHGQYQSSQSGHSPYTVSQPQHSFGTGQAGAVSYTGSQPIRGECAWCMAACSVGLHSDLLVPCRSSGLPHHAVSVSPAAGVYSSWPLHRSSCRVYASEQHHSAPEAA
ncbi:hypothetical protein GDO78_013780 [Eleutherodactylus coqui]|uniref:G protein pathway suppressor 2 n=1 Tax=Eleutherodactylus coqui TaxID=57060 RepID=A0A8J6E4W2_ELECQ|nr:hypothetical protein GDO78_013780 [Eleutherodactylus coqui]